VANSDAPGPEIGTRSCWPGRYDGVPRRGLKLSSPGMRPVTEPTQSAREQLIARTLLTLSIVLPYFRLTTMTGVIITDDRIVSDVMNAEFPARVAVGNLVRSGQPPVWLAEACGGFPLLAGGGGASDPVTHFFFGIFPAVVALNLFLLAVLLLAAHTTYSYARHLGARTIGALLAGFAFAYSGFMVSQLKHLGIVLVVAWFPLALLLLERALDASSETLPRLRSLLGFSFVFGLQVLAGFPQTAYICALFYGTYALARAWSLRRKAKRRGRFVPPLVWLGAFGVAMALGIALGMALLLPMAELASVSDRSAGITMEWVSRTKYWPRNVLTFLFPYINGDVSDGTYVPRSIFWEDYGYVGFFTFLLAGYATARERRRAHVMILAATCVVAFLIVLGPSTPVFRAAFAVVPGMKNFRFPTRFLFLVDFSLVVLAGIGLTRFEDDARGWLEKRGHAARAFAIAAGLLGVTVVDLLVHQLRQNPIVDAYDWMDPPVNVRAIRKDSAQYGKPFRIYTPQHYMIHNMVFARAHGWADVAPYFAYRDFIQPNTNIFWGMSSADCYAGLAPKPVLDFWGDINFRPDLIHRTFAVRGTTIAATPGFVRLLSMNNVRYVVTPWELQQNGVELIEASTPVRVYRLAEALPRAYVVPRATFWSDDKALADRLLTPEFDPRREVAVLGPSLGPDVAADVEGDGRADILQNTATEVKIAAESRNGGYLVLSDTWYPGWIAEVDGRAVEILRANVTQRAIVLPPGKHEVRFHFSSRVVRRGVTITVATFAAYLLAAIALNVRRLRRSTPQSNPASAA